MFVCLFLFMQICRSPRSRTAECQSWVVVVEEICTETPGWHSAGWRPHQSLSQCGRTTGGHACLIQGKGTWDSSQEPSAFPGNKAEYLKLALLPKGHQKCVCVYCERKREQEKEWKRAPKRLLRQGKEWRK